MYSTDHVSLYGIITDVTSNSKKLIPKLLSLKTYSLWGDECILSNGNAVEWRQSGAGSA